MSPRIYRPFFDPAEQPEAIAFDLIWFLPIAAAVTILCSVALILFL